ncbi:Mycobactin import ATP-binding/permease protein IrtA [Frankliniella fusca]|uniref:Mycobactin import ATP-binding/permease protein IrtA n=1 Tax=Frankliniella fusca TaxID=407009 RepID=A0AAE1HU58_9NEOP|nr:Mycobactin import ATP-binding/permease protein IrtA [Frankliniella fusca]
MTLLALALEVLCLSLDPPRPYLAQVISSEKYPTVFQRPFLSWAKNPPILSLLASICRRVSNFSSNNARVASCRRKVYNSTMNFLSSSVHAKGFSKASRGLNLLGSGRASSPAVTNKPKIGMVFRNNTALEGCARTPGTVLPIFIFSVNTSGYLLHSSLTSVFSSSVRSALDKSDTFWSSGSTSPTSVPFCKQNSSSLLFRIGTRSSSSIRHSIVTMSGLSSTIIGVEIAGQIRRSSANG